MEDIAAARDDAGDAGMRLFLMERKMADLHSRDIGDQVPFPFFNLPNRIAETDLPFP